MKRTSLLAIMSLASALSVAQAQSLSFYQTNYRNDSNRSVNGKAEFRFPPLHSSGGARTPTRPIGFSLMPAGGGSPSRTLGVLPMATTSAAGPLFTVAHDATLVGEGTAGSPLGVAVPLILMGAVEGPSRGIINVRNTLGPGIIASGGPVNEGVHAEGGSNDNGFGGSGVTANGGVGSGAGFSGGIGIVAFHGFGVDGAHDGRAGLFFGDVAVSGGDVTITGTLSKGGGSFKIDHPLDPTNKYLYHSFVESPDMKNIYDGNVTTDENGEATVTLPSYFDALNRDFRYQLTVIGTFAQAIVAEKIKANSFKIRTSAAGVEVSWQVTGIRRDGWANRNRIPVEEDKPEVERGYYLHPEAFDQPEEKSIEWARDREMMKQLKHRRVEAEQSRKRMQR